MKVRIDKFIWCVRLAKTRSLATELVSKNKVKLNQSETKASKEVKINDIISIQKHNSFFEYKVLNLLENRVGARLVEDYLLDVTKPEEIQKFKLYKEAQSVYRENGSGKPTKKDRRDLDDFLDW